MRCEELNRRDQQALDAVAAALRRLTDHGRIEIRVRPKFVEVHLVHTNLVYSFSVEPKDLQRAT